MELVDRQLLGEEHNTDPSMDYPPEPIHVSGAEEGAQRIDLDPTTPHGDTLDQGVSEFEQNEGVVEPPTRPATFIDDTGEPPAPTPRRHDTPHTTCAPTALDTGTSSAPPSPATKNVAGDLHAH
jgi:hypothetical protein